MTISMPKFKGENEKVVAARERKAAQKAQKASEAAAAKELVDAASWAQGSNASGIARRKAKEDKAAEKLAHKQALRAEAEEDMATAVKGAKKKAKSKGAGLPDDLLAAMDAAGKKKGKTARKPAKRQGGGVAPKAPRISTSTVLSESPSVPRGKTVITEQSENIFEFGGSAANRAVADAGASGIQAGIEQLSVGGGGAGLDRHPERRVKAAFKAWEERELPRIRAELPGLKLSQVRVKVEC